MPHSQPTAPQQTVCKFHLDPQYHIFHWGSTILGDSTLCHHLLIIIILSKDIFEASFLLWSHYPKRVSKEIANTFNLKTTNYSWLKQLLNPLSSPFYLYGGNFLPLQFKAIALYQHINPCNFSRSLVISLKFSVNITDPPRSWIMCKNI